MAKVIMVQGTMSNAGKSLIVAGLCRIFYKDGYKVAPFKSQNMALNSYITEDGLEIGRAQAMQAEACGIEPTVYMNPILLKPTTDMGSQVIVNGVSIGNMPAMEYFQYKKKLIPEVLKAYEKLASENDIIVVEGAGSPAEINLKANDIVNMGLAKLLDAPVLLVGDIDRGGVFAQLYGTVELLESDERARIKGMIINKFRGDKEILKPGLNMIGDKCHINVVGVVPYIKVDIEDEDSLSTRLSQKMENLPLATTSIANKDSRDRNTVNIAVIRLPKISNFTDFGPLEALDNVNVRYVAGINDLNNPDGIIIPGTKNTIEDLKWLRQSGLEAAIKKLAAKGTIVCGICGGYQMLGINIKDDAGVEGYGSIDGMGLLNVETKFAPSKRTTKSCGHIIGNGITKPLAMNDTMSKVTGYEIHMGKTKLFKGASPLILSDNNVKDGCIKDNVFGTYYHGIFENPGFTSWFIEEICRRSNISGFSHIFDNIEKSNYADYKNSQFDILEKSLRENLDMEMIYKIVNGRA